MNNNSTKSETLELLFQYASPRNTELEIRLGAIDALGNFYKTISVTTIESIVHQNYNQNNSIIGIIGNSNNIEDNNESEDNNNKNDYYKNNDSTIINSNPNIELAAGQEIKLLQILLKKSLSILLENLRECVGWISNDPNWFDGD